MQAEAKNQRQVRSETVLANFVPYSSHVTDSIIKTVNGDYLCTWKLAGISFEAEDPQEILNRHNGLNELIRAIGRGNVAFWSHKVRRKISDSLQGNFDSKFSRELDQKYYASFQGYRMMANELYLTVVYRPTQSKVVRFFSKAVKRSVEEIRIAQNEAINTMHELMIQVKSSMKRYEPELLQTYDKDGTKFSKPLEFLGFLLNGFWEPVPLRRTQINEYLPTSRLFVGGETIELRQPTQTRYVKLLDFNDYPQTSEPGIVNAVLYDDYEFIETHSFTSLSKYDGSKALQQQRGHLIASEDAGASQIQAMDEAEEGVINGTFVMGEYHYSLAVFGDSMQQVSKSIGEARASLQEQGFQASVVDLVPDGAWFAQMPANWKYRPREAKLTSRNFAGLAPYHNFASGKRSGNPWGDAVTILKTQSGQPYYFNFHVTEEDEDSEDKKAPANTLVLGETGTGKTVLTLFLLAQAMKFSPTVVYFDKDQGAEIAIRALGGNYNTLKMGQPTGFNPFQWEANPQNILFLEALVKKLCDHPSYPLTPKDEQDITHAIKTVAVMPKNLRRLSTVRQNLPIAGETSLNARLRKWCQGGALDWVLDNPTDVHDFAKNRINGYDYTDFLDDAEVRTPIMMVLMYLTESQIDGRRFIYFMAEFWKPLADPVFMDFAKNKQKTIRKQNGFGIFDSQSPSDALANPIARALIEQSVTKIFLPNPSALHDDYVNGFNLTEAEYLIIRNLNPNSRMFLIKQGHQSVVAKLDLAGFDDELNVLSGTTDNAELLTKIRETTGDDPDIWLPHFYRLVNERKAAVNRIRV